MKSLVLIAAIFSLFQFGSVEDGELKSHLQSTWQNQHDSIINGKGEIVLYRAASIRIPVAGLDEAEGWFNSLRDVENEAQLLQIMSAEWLPRFEKFSTGYQKDKSVWDTTVQVLFDGDYQRAKWVGLSKEHNPEYVSLPNAFIIWSSQFDCHSIKLSSNQEMFDKNNLRIAMWFESNAGSIQSVERLSDDSKNCRLILTNNREMEVNCESGFIRKVTRENEATSEFWLQFNDIGDGFPRVAVKGIIKENHLAYVDVRLLKTVDFNLDLGTDAFNMFANRDGQVMDLRKGEDQIELVPIRSGQNVLDVANQVTFAAPAEIVPKSNNGFDWLSPVLFFLICLAFSAALVFAKQITVSLFSSKGSRND